MFKKTAIAFIAFISASAASITMVQAKDVEAHAQNVEAHVTSSVIQSGTFKGLSNHVTTGGVSIIKTGSGHIAILESNFDLDGAPAPTLGFGNGEFDTETEFTKLESIKGLQVYAIPASINPADYSQFYVWCADFSVPLGVASFE